MWKIYVSAAMLWLVLSPSHLTATALSDTAPSIARNDAGTGANVDDQTIDRELALFRTAQISLCQALVRAEKLHPGSKTWDIGFDGSPASPVYRVKTMASDRIWENAIDAQSGDVAGEEAVSFVKDLNAENQHNVDALKSVRQDLFDAVLVAERAAKGKAIGGTLLRDSGRLSFVVVIVSGDDLKQVTLDPPRAGRGGRSTRQGAAVRRCN
ncbi:PepSY domain-containing protein [Bradyrhizobium sp. STM 3562]|uniref:PepSY domain-containing protein n=1 Tax=Bradyrhizobium sp. STM 3562 TaxID=578924 RepID=UPI003890F630